MADDQLRPAKKRRPWLAAILSFLCPGLGQLYNTQIKFGLQLYAIAFSLVVLAGIIFLIPPNSIAVVLIFLLVASIGFGVMIWAVIIAFVSAKRLGEVELNRYNRVLIYFVMYALWIGTVQVASAKWLPFTRWENFKIPAGSMIPSLKVGDHLFSWRFAWRDRSPERGELTIFKLPRDKRIDFVKRIIGLPGDTIEMRGGRLVLNGSKVQRVAIKDYVGDRGTKIKQYTETLPNGRQYKIIEVRGDTGGLDNTRTYQVPQGHVFVMGDNRDNSLDSRVNKDMSPNWIGFVPIDNIYAKPTFIYWARDKSRIGLKVE